MGQRKGQADTYIVANIFVLTSNHTPWEILANDGHNTMRDIEVFLEPLLRRLEIKTISDKGELIDLDPNDKCFRSVLFYKNRDRDDKEDKGTYYNYYMYLNSKKNIDEKIKKLIENKERLENSLNIYLKKKEEENGEYLFKNDYDEYYNIKGFESFLTKEDIEKGIEEINSDEENDNEENENKNENIEDEIKVEDFIEEEEDEDEIEKNEKYIIEDIENLEIKKEEILNEINFNKKEKISLGKSCEVYARPPEEINNPFVVKAKPKKPDLIEPKEDEKDDIKIEEIKEKK
jgi:hypothetical protein